MTSAPAARSPRGPYAKGVERRAAILEVAGRLFRANGYEPVSLRDIAAEAGVSHPMVKHYFGSKEELLLAVLAERDAEIFERVERLHDHPEGMPRLSLEAASEHIGMDGYLGAFTKIAAEASSVEHPAHLHFRERYEAGVRLSNDLFDALRARGLLATDAEPEVLSRLALAVQDGLQLQWLYNPEAVDLPGLIDAFFAIIIPEKKSREDAGG